MKMAWNGALFILIMEINDCNIYRVILLFVGKYRTTGNMYVCYW